MPNVRMPMACLLILTALAAVNGQLHALDASKNGAVDLDDNEIEEKYITKILEEAAKYRIRKSHYTADPADEKEAAAYLSQAKAVLVDGANQPLEDSWHWLSPRWWLFSPSPVWRSGWLAQDGFLAHSYASVAGDLLSVELESYAKRGAIADLHDALFRMWFYLPDYPEMPRVMDLALVAAEKVQDFRKSVHLEEENPGRVIQIEGESALMDVNKLFRFLVLHGDRESVAPRAAIGLARALLRSGDKDNLYLARREYERFCETYPSHELVFTALCERALSYLVAYKGNNYDVGVLISAATIIDQAEIESKGRPENVLTVAAYRKRIRSWHQDRDLEVARWYRDRVILGLSWLMCPGTADDSWHGGARFYYREVIRRDSGSDQARIAFRELNQLSLPTANELGTDLAPPAKP
jgi:hypothetical protein